MRKNPRGLVHQVREGSYNRNPTQSHTLPLEPNVLVSFVFYQFCFFIDIYFLCFIDIYFLAIIVIPSEFLKNENAMDGETRKLFWR